MRGQAAILIALALAAASAGAAQGKGGQREKPDTPTKKELVPVERAVLLDGKPFPARKTRLLSPPSPGRTLYVAAGASGGDGSEKSPWGDLQQALTRLSPGDRLIVGKGTWAGAFRIDGSCQAGSREAPIQLVGGGLVRATGTGAALSVARPYWWIEGLTMDAAAVGEPLLILEKEAAGATVNRVTLKPGPRPGLAIRGAARVTVSAVLVRAGGQGIQTEPSPGVIVGAGSSSVVLQGLTVSATGGPGVRIGGDPGEAPANVTMTSSTVQNSLGSGVRVMSGRNVVISDCDLHQSASLRVASGEGLRIEGGTGITVRGSRIADFALAVRIGVRRVGEPAGAVPEEVVIERSLLESRTGRGAGVVIEGGRDVRISNDLLSGLEDAFVVFGGPPAVERLTVANNLAIGISRLAFRLEAPSAATLFDYNVFSPAKADLSVETGSETATLPAFLRKGMKHSAQVSGVFLAQGDLGAVKGVETVDRGTPIPGVPYRGKAPDVGLAER